MITDVKYHILAIFSLVRIGFVKLQIYRLSASIKILSSILLVVLQYYLWSAIYESNPDLEYTFNQMFLYLLLSQVIFTIFPSGISSQIAQLVQNGDIIHKLLKPYGILKQFFFESIGSCIFSICYIGIPIVVVSLVFFDFQITELEYRRIIYFFEMLLFSYLFVFEFEAIIGLCSFYTLNAWGLQSFKYAIITLFSGRFLPLYLYPDYIKKIVEILPFKMMFFLPLDYLLNDNIRNASDIISYQIFWVLIIFLLMIALVKVTQKKVLIQGG